MIGFQIEQDLIPFKTIVHAHNLYSFMCKHLFICGSKPMLETSSQSCKESQYFTLEVLLYSRFMASIVMILVFLYVFCLWAQKMQSFFKSRKKKGTYIFKY